MGTVVEVQVAEVPEDGRTTAAAVVVQWDNGNRCNYRCGVAGQYDLRVFDSAPSGRWELSPRVAISVCSSNSSGHVDI